MFTFCISSDQALVFSDVYFLLSTNERRAPEMMPTEKASLMMVLSACATQYKWSEHAVLLQTNPFQCCSTANCQTNFLAIFLKKKLLQYKNVHSLAGNCVALTISGFIEVIHH